MVQECGTTMFTIYSAALPNVIKLRDDIIFYAKKQRSKGAKEAICVFISYAPWREIP
jgi:hypothetical protein